MTKDYIYRALIGVWVAITWLNSRLEALEKRLINRAGKHIEED